MSGSGSPLEPTLALQQPEGAGLSGRYTSFPLPVAAALRVLKNFLSQAGSNLLAQAFAFFSTAYVARCLQAEGFGWVGFAQGLLTYFTLVTDLGLRTIGTREVAKHREDLPKLVGHVLGLRIALASVSMAVFVTVIAVLPKAREFKFFLLGYGFLIYTSALLLDWVFQGLERMELVAVGEVLRAGSYLALVLIALHHRSEILRVPILTALSQLLPVALLFAIFGRQFRRIRPTLDFAIWKDLLRQSLPISLGGLALQFATGLDVVLLGFLRPALEVGYYNAAFRLVYMPTGFTTVLGFTMFPVMARYWKEQPEKLGSITTYLGRVLLLMGLPLVIAGWFFAPSVLTLVYGRGFLPATLCFRILLGFLLVCHIYAPFLYLLPACGKEKGFMKGMMVGAAFGLPANLILIPLYGAPGAALAKVLAHAVVVAYVYRLTAQEIAPVRLLNELSRSILVAAPMGALVWLAPGGWWVKLGVGLIVYLGLVALLEGKAWYALAGSGE